MKFRHTVAVLSQTFAVLIGCCVGSLSAQAQTNANLVAVLAQMDQASAQFKGAEADFVWDYYQAVVKETTTQTGPIYFERTPGGTQMGAVLLDAQGKKNRVLEYKGGILRFYDATNNQVRVLKAGSNQAQYESFLTLGFGGSGRDLARTWNITDLGPETLTDSGHPVKTEKLDLIGKDPEVVKMFTHVTIWVDPVRGVSLRQIFDTPSHDRRTATYSHVRLTKKIDQATFKISGDAILVK